MTCSDSTVWWAITQAGQGPGCDNEQWHDSWFRWIKDGTKVERHRDRLSINEIWDEMRMEHHTTYDIIRPVYTSPPGATRPHHVLEALAPNGLCPCREGGFRGIIIININSHYYNFNNNFHDTQGGFTRKDRGWGVGTQRSSITLTVTSVKRNCSCFIWMVPHRWSAQQILRLWNNVRGCVLFQVLLIVQQPFYNWSFNR